MKNTSTKIHSNGSKWYGEEPDTIQKLVERLNLYTIEERFFCKFQRGFGADKKKYTLCPISKENGSYIFFGNFLEVSAVFNIETNNPEIIQQLKKAIINNKGWKQYIHKLKKTEFN